MLREVQEVVQGSLCRTLGAGLPSINLCADSEYKQCIAK